MGCDEDHNCTAITYPTFIQGDLNYGLCEGKFEDSEYDHIYAKGDFFNDLFRRPN